MAEKITIKSAWGEEKRVLQRLDKMLAPHTFCEEDCLDIKTAVAEACLNAMEHGNGLQPELPVLIIVSLIDNTITVDVSDRGKGFEVFNRRADDSGRGWGMLFIQNLVDEWALYCSVETQGYGVRMKKAMRKGNGGS
jgi:serine/threonine-protein kinase RsbW